MRKDFNKREQFLKEKFLNAAIESEATNKETLRVLSYLIKLEVWKK